MSKWLGLSTLVLALLAALAYTSRLGEPETAATPGVREGLTPRQSSVALEHAPETRPVPVAETRRTIAGGGPPAENSHEPALIESVAAPGEEAQPSIVIARAVDEAGVALAGAVLRFIDERREGYHASAEPSGPDGVMRLTLDARALLRWDGKPMAAVFSSEAPERALHMFRATPIAEGTRDLGDLVLAPGGSVSGVVVDDTGRTIESAEVLVADVALKLHPVAARLAGPKVGLGLPRSTTTTHGAFSVPFVPTGPARLWARKGLGTWTYSKPIEVAFDAETAGIRLVVSTPKGSDAISGRVLSPTGAPVPKAEVYAVPMGRFPGDAKVIADAEGRFVIHPTNLSPHLVLAKDASDRWRASFERAVAIGSEVELRLGEAAWMQVSVVDSNGDPVRDAYVNPEFGEIAHYVARQVRETAPGRSEMMIPEEEFHVTVYASEYEETREGPFQPLSAPRELRIELNKKPSVSGRVLANGEPVAGADVRVCERMQGGFRIRSRGFLMDYDVHIGERRTKTDENGRFEIHTGGDDRSYMAIAEHPGWALAEYGPFAIDARGKKDVDLLLTRGGAIEGRLSYTSGQDPRSQLIATCRGDGIVHTTRTDEDGRYRFENLRPGPWRIEHREREMEVTWTVVAQDSDDVFEPNCTVIEGESTRHDFVLDEGKDGLLHGHLSIVGGSSAGWSARLASAEYGADDPQARATLLGDDGHFELRADPGPYRLILRSPADTQPLAATWTEPVTLEAVSAAGPHEWSMEMRTGTLVGRVAEASTLRFRTAENRKIYDAVFQTADDGSFTVDVLASSGVLQTREYEPDRFSQWKQLRVVNIEPGGTVEIELE
ncbi:MAG: carboxypeptidase regulatory-like domain-containing protein [bacterium]|nr:carboxypeptidase regulatory-like domain-containing protein [bacterium]